jgi:hypothetical protein
MSHARHRVTVEVQVPEENNRWAELSQIMSSDSKVLAQSLRAMADSLDPPLTPQEAATVLSGLFSGKKGDDK